MAFSREYLEYALDQLRLVPDLTHRRMFGGVGLYSDGVFFGLIDDDVIYFKVDDATRPRYLSAGSRPFQPFGEESKPMSYYSVPADVLEDPAELKQWAATALAVALTKPPRKRARRRKT